MIDEKKLIEDIQGLTVVITGLRSGKDVISRFIKEYQKSVLRIIQEQPQADKWIPCEERLPDKEGTYLTTTEYGGVLVNHFYERNRSWGYKKFRTIAWMSLPVPYKKEGAE